MHKYEVRAVLPEEAAEISSLAMCSKAYWGYDADFMTACESELSFSSEHIISEQSFCRAAAQGDDMLGFYLLVFRDNNNADLEALFVSPQFIGQGFGAMLFNDAKHWIKNGGVASLRVQSDPFARDFYANLGGQLFDEQESQSIPGRFLPVFHFSFDTK